MRALPVAGVSGTLKHRMRAPPLLGHVVAKTGHDEHCLVTRPATSTAHIAFAIIQNGHPLSYWWAREAQDRFARVLATQ